MIHYLNNKLESDVHLKIDDQRSCLIFCTMPDKIAAHNISQILLNSKLAACITLFPNAMSIYPWQGKIETQFEIQLIIKTHIILQQSVFRTIKTYHSYQIPELLTLPIIGGDLAYLSWLTNCLR
ncbi:divalent cation tolerance protein CutA [Candidatus Curculioniphilus buchneri]|uniref:divalent cation tolerance protein CutA n=1 Tax=Candidatus Curculioniphilus buchneri TaxID=690594 RepID=UPI00376EDC38